MGLEIISNPAQIGPMLKAHRKRMGWPLKTMAARLGMSVSGLSDLESGRHNPSIYVLFQACKALDIIIWLEPHPSDHC